MPFYLPCTMVGLSRVLYLEVEPTDEVQSLPGFPAVVAQGRRYVFHSPQAQHPYYQVPQCRQQLGRRPRPHLALVLAKDHVPHPVQPVLDPPVPPLYLQQPGGVRPLRRQAGDGVGPFHRLPALVNPGPLHTAHLSQPRPVQVFVQGRRRPQPPPFPPVSVAALPAGIVKALAPRRLLKQQAHRLLYPRLVVFQRPEVIPALLPSGSTPAGNTVRLR